MRQSYLCFFAARTFFLPYLASLPPSPCAYVHSGGKTLPRSHVILPDTSYSYRLRRPSFQPLKKIWPDTNFSRLVRL
jgi:hypothetical protein